MGKLKTTASGKPLNLHAIVLAVLYIFCLLCYGGFHETILVIAGISVAVPLLLKKSAFRITLNQGLFFLFAVWYFCCSLQGGFFIEYVSRGLIPFVALLFWIYISNTPGLKEDAVKIITKASFFVATIAILHCAVQSATDRTLYRLTFPFDYSNVCGIYFAVCFFWSKKCDFRYRRFVFLTAVVLSQSVGALGLLVLAFTYQLIKNKKYLIVLAEIALFGIVAFLLRGRLLESSSTFLERLLQIQDGIFCILDNPVCGIGAGKWQFAKWYYQTGFYGALLMHSSVFEMGANSGFVGMLLFAAVCFLEIKKAFVKKCDFVPAAIILVHGLMDFSLSFITVVAALVLSLADTDTEKSFTINVRCGKICSAGVCLMLCFLLMGNLQATAFQRNISLGLTAADACEKFENNLFLKCSVKSAQSLCANMYREKEYTDSLKFENYKYLPTEMILYNSMDSEKGEDYLLERIRKQPYNVYLKRLVSAECSESCKEEIKRITLEAIENLSFLGKILYDLI
ncbi:MAG: O-antigen ligase family protein [Clostridia bacterium]|nr:O-antigen ligase family protein [Clostridia bacterium]